MQLLQTLLVLSSLCVVMLSALGDQCRCSMRLPDKKPLFCPNHGPPNKVSPKPHFHEDRDITGDCLPEVGEK